MKVGDKVKLKYIPDDLRYDVKLGDVGEIVEVDDKLYTFRKSKPIDLYADEVIEYDPPRLKEYNIAVKWYRGESAMTHKPCELELVVDTH